MDPRKSLFSQSGLKDVAQHLRSRTPEEAEQIRNRQINTSDMEECVSVVGFSKTPFALTSGGLSTCLRPQRRSHRQQSKGGLGGSHAPRADWHSYSSVM